MNCMQNMDSIFACNLAFDLCILHIRCPCDLHLLVSVLMPCRFVPKPTFISLCSFFCPYNRRVGSQLLLSATTLHPSGGYQHWRQLHAQSYGGTHIWISMQYTTHFQAPHTTKRHRRTDKHSRCLNGSCSAVAGYVETSKSSRWLTMPSHGEMGSQPRSPEVTVALTDNQAHLISTAITTLPLKVRRGLDMARNPLPGTPINLPVVRTGPETHPQRTAVSAPRGPLYRVRRSTYRCGGTAQAGLPTRIWTQWRREQAWARAVQTAWTEPWMRLLIET